MENTQRGGKEKRGVFRSPATEEKKEEERDAKRKRGGGREEWNEREFFTKIRSAPVTRKLVCQKARETSPRSPLPTGNANGTFMFSSSALELFKRKRDTEMPERVQIYGLIRTKLCGEFEIGHLEPALTDI